MAFEFNFEGEEKEPLSKEDVKKKASQYEEEQEDIEDVESSEESEESKTPAKTTKPKTIRPQKPRVSTEQITELKTKFESIENQNKQNAELVINAVKENANETKFILEKVETMNNELGEMKQFMINTLKEMTQKIDPSIKVSDQNYEERIILLFIQRYHHEGGRKKPHNKWQVMDQGYTKMLLGIQSNEGANFTNAWRKMINEDKLRKFDEKRYLITEKALISNEKFVDNFTRELPEGDQKEIDAFLKNSNKKRAIDYYIDNLVNNEGFIAKNISKSHQT